MKCQAEEEAARSLAGFKEKCHQIGEKWKVIDFLHECDAMFSEWKENERREKVKF